MNLDTFVQQRRPSWQELEKLLTRVQRNPTTLTEMELSELGQLYRSVTSDLALAQRDFASQRVTVYLNQLVGRAHAQIYRGEPMRRNALWLFYRQTFPQLYRELLPYTTLAFLLFTITALIAFVIVWQQPDAIYIFEGAEIAPLVREVENGKLWTDIAPAVRSAASAFILTNNIRVSFLAFAGGIMAGLLTLWIMVSNGLHIGAIFGLLQAHGLSGGLAEFVVAHGFIELSVIFVAGGCGLYFGDGLLRPGLLARREALSQRGRISVQVIFGCAPLLVVAGLIEGFISPSGLPWLLKLTVGLTTGILLHYYWLRGGHAKIHDSEATIPQAITSIRADRFTLKPTPAREG